MASSLDSEKVWEQLRLLSKKQVRQILSVLVGPAGGDPIAFQDIIPKLQPRVAYSTANQLVKQMRAAGLVELEGGQQTGWKIRPNRKFKILLTLESVYVLETGKALPPSR